MTPGICDRLMRAPDFHYCTITYTGFLKPEKCQTSSGEALHRRPARMQSDWRVHQQQGGQIRISLRITEVRFVAWTQRSGSLIETVFWTVMCRFCTVHIVTHSFVAVWCQHVTCVINKVNIMSLLWSNFSVLLSWILWSGYWFDLWPVKYVLVTITRS